MAISNTKKYLFLALLVVLLIGGGWAWFALSADYSDGSRVGTVRKISRKGVVFKTWEGELDLTNYARASSDDAIWKFSVEDDQVARKIEELQGSRVRLQYEEKYYQFDWRGETNYFVTKVEKAE